MTWVPSVFWAFWYFKFQTCVKRGWTFSVREMPILEKPKGSSRQEKKRDRGISEPFEIPETPVICNVFRYFFHFPNFRDKNLDAKICAFQVAQPEQEILSFCRRWIRLFHIRFQFQLSSLGRRGTKLRQNIHLLNIIHSIKDFDDKISLRKSSVSEFSKRWRQKNVLVGKVCQGEIRNFEGFWKYPTSSTFKIGCDLQFNSNAKEDICGVCNGTGTSCKIISGSFTGSQSRNLTRVYEKVATIPAGARKLKISEDIPKTSANFIALESIGGDPILNWNYRIQWTGRWDRSTRLKIQSHRNFWPTFFFVAICLCFL